MSNKKKEDTSAYIPPFISAPTKFDPLGDDFEEWWLTADIYLKIVGRALPEDTKAAILLSLFHPPTQRKLQARAKETSKQELQDLSFDEVKALVFKVLKTTKAIISERFTTLTLRQDANSSIDDWAAKVLEQTHKFDFNDFTFDDFQTLIYVIGLRNDNLRKELFKKMSSLHSLSPPSKLSFTAAHKLCKDHLCVEMMYRTIRQQVEPINATYQVEGDPQLKTSELSEVDEVNYDENVTVHKVNSPSENESRRDESHIIKTS
jgi:hypothetical protein